MHNYAKKARKAYKKSTDEEKLKVVSEVLDKGRNRKEIAREMNVSLTSINNWVRSYQLYGKDGLSSEKRESFVELEETQKELKRLKNVEKKYKKQVEEIEILKKFQAFLKESEQVNDTKPYRS